MKILTLMASALCATCFAQAPTNGLVAFYPFCGNANDASGNNLNLTAYGSPQLTTDRFGNAANAYVFNGSSDYFQNNNYGPLGDHSRSVTFWAKTAVTSNMDGQAVLYYGSNTNGAGERFEVGLNGQCLGLYTDIGYGQVDASFTTNDNLWHHYAVAFDSTVAGDLSAVSYYVDGALVSTYCYVYGPNVLISTTGGNGITIGNLYTPYSRFFNGAIDEVRLYNRPLSAAEVTAIYQ